jgi:hypothetical protein
MAMTDDRTETSSADRKKVASDAKYEFDFAAKKADAKPDEVRAAIKKVGNSRAKVEKELKK